MEKLAVPACLGCGACCFSKLASYVRVEGSDHARLGGRVDELTVFDGNRCYMRMQDGHCAALVVDVATRRFVCSVYGSRPSVCRELERASPQCRAELHEKSPRPLALLRERYGQGQRLGPNAEAVPGTGEEPFQNLKCV